MDAASESAPNNHSPEPGEPAPDVLQPPSSPPSGAFGAATHVPPSHKLPGAHCSLVVQVSKQLPLEVSQRNGGHALGTPSREVEVVASVHSDVRGSHCESRQTLPVAQSAAVVHDVRQVPSGAAH